MDGERLAGAREVAIAADPEDPRVGSTVCNGRYRIVRRVADGGMGRVYQALEKGVERSVALKILHRDIAQDAVAVERFKREFEHSAALPHDYIVDVLDFQKTEDGSYALVMEFLEGEELRTLLKREKALRPERVIRMMAQVAIGLQAAHDRKIVHRDMKPDNIFLCGTRHGDLLKILDFGSVRDNSVGAKKLTVIGTTIGSPYYMSPEQAQALPELDHRADIWSVAAITYECLTGHLPFPGNKGPAILLGILTADPVPPSDIGRELGVPPTLDVVIEEGLAKNPALRMQTIGAFVDRVGYAFGLAGSHLEWARTPEEDLATRISAGLPNALARYAEHPRRDKLASIDNAFKAGSEGGPGAFADDVIMGVPNGPPAWFYPVLAGALALGAVAAWLLVR